MLSSPASVLLIHITGQDKPGLTRSLMRILADYGVRILDIGQAVAVREREILAQTMGDLIQVQDGPAGGFERTEVDALLTALDPAQSALLFKDRKGSMSLSSATAKALSLRLTAA